MLNNIRRFYYFDRSHALAPACVCCLINLFIKNIKQNIVRRETKKNSWPSESERTSEWMFINSREQSTTRSRKKSCVNDWMWVSRRWGRDRVNAMQPISPIRISAKDSKRNQWTSWGRVQAHTNTIFCGRSSKIGSSARAQSHRKMIPDQRLAMLIILWILMCSFVCVCVAVHMHFEYERVKKSTNTQKEALTVTFPCSSCASNKSCSVRVRLFLVAVAVVAVAALNWIQVYCTSTLRISNQISEWLLTSFFFV